MCEIIRAAIAAGKMQKVTSDVQGIPVSILDEIDCYGSEKQTEICAVNNESFFKKASWTILLDAMSLSINKKTRWVKMEGGAEKSEGDAEEDKEMQKKLEESEKKDGVEEEGEEEERILMVWMGNDSKYKTARPPCTDLETTGKEGVLKGVELIVNKLEKKNVMVVGTVVGTMQSVSQKKKLGGMITGGLQAKGKDQVDSLFQVGRDRSFGVSTGFTHSVKGKEDFKVGIKVGGDA